MPLEDLTGSNKFIDALDETNPVGSVDYMSTVDNHIRGVKNVLKNTFSNLTGAVTASHTELKRLTGIATAIINFLAAGSAQGALNALGFPASLSGQGGKVVQVNSGETGYEFALAFPTGAVVDYAGASAPAGWLVCDGTAVSRSTYSALFTAIGTTYGAGDGSTTFNLPDARGRATIGVGQGNTAEGGGAGTNRTLGASGGEESHTLSAAEMPAHAHSSGSLVAASNGTHSHNVNVAQTGGGVSGVAGNATAGAASVPSTTSAGAHTHTITGSTTSAGSSSSHENMSPFLALNKIIRT